MQKRLTVQGEGERSLVQRDLTRCTLAAVHVILLLAVAQLTDAAFLARFAAGLGAMFFLGRLIAYGTDREVMRLLPRLGRQYSRRQLVLAGQAAILRLSAVVLGLGALVASLLHIGGREGASFAIAIALGAVGVALFDSAAAPPANRRGAEAGTTPRAASLPR